MILKASSRRKGELPRSTAWWKGVPRGTIDMTLDIEYRPRVSSKTRWRETVAVVANFSSSPELSIRHDNA